MKHTRGYIRLLVLFAFLALCGAGEASAQVPLDRYRSAKTFVRSGLMPKPDSLAKNHLTDSLLLMRVDSLLQDSTLRDSLLRSGIDSLRLRDSLAARLHPQFVPDSALLLKTDSLPAALGAPDSLAGRKDLRPRRDTISLSGVSWISLVAPGFGQIYNKQYWKLPILYGTVGAGLTLFFHENNTYKPLKRQYNALLENGTARTEELDDVQSRMIRSNTRRQIYLGLTVASYLYFLGDAAVNYRYDASPVKKATTLATIFPGAGQVYNKSYWKLPFVVGGLATTIYTIDWNNRGYTRFKKAYSDRSAYDKALEEHQKDPEHHPDPPVAKGEFGTKYSAEFLKNLKDNYRRNRDLCIIITAGLYVLQIIDAHVDAHLKSYDISDDLSVEFTPAVNYVYSPTVGGHRPTFGFNFNLNF